MNDWNDVTEAWYGGRYDPGAEPPTRRESRPRRAEAGRVTRYVTDDRRPAPSRRSCAWCGSDLADRTLGTTCPRSYARCHYQVRFVPNAEFPTLPASLVLMIVKAADRRPRLAEIASLAAAA